MLEQGNDIHRRSCPIVSKKVPSCILCKDCDIMNGFGGAGAFSDGKYNFTTSFGGWLTDYLDEDYIMELIEYIDSVNIDFGATEERYSTETPDAKKISTKALGFDLHLLSASVKHLGTENNREMLKRMFDYLTQKVEIACNTHVSSIKQTDFGYSLTLGDGQQLNCKYLVVAPGRSGAEWFSEQCKALVCHLLITKGYRCKS